MEAKDDSRLPKSGTRRSALKANPVAWYVITEALPPSLIGLALARATCYTTYTYTHKSMGLDGIHPRVLRELVEVLTKPLVIIYQQFWLTREVPVDWRSANVMPIYKKGQKEDLDNYRPVSLGKVMEQIILSAITWHVQDNQVIRPSQHGFMKGRSCLTNLISFYYKVTCLVDEGKAVSVYLDFSIALTPLPTAFSWRNWLLMA
ncbi:mitochondrial enolase superfamily member 1 [Grus japonensis]|uniref:Mitochondrial enolase superfamily member 1 n=1 Tax=Grus japonensis TaxID=30415 RepID=A0ABC9Y188_GRUJA